MAVITVAFSDLNTWLQNQPANTASTPYELEITGLTNSYIGSAEISGTLGYILSHNNTKYVDLSSTEMPVTAFSLLGTFYGCSALVKAPPIDGLSITDMGATFRGCASLRQTPTIPQGVTDMSYTFYGCSSLTTAPVIPNSVTNMYSTFQNCSSLTSAPVIPNSITSLSYTFRGCTALATAPVIPSNVTSLSGTFLGCTSLVTAPVIPNSVTSINSAFSGCTSLTTAPVIPNNVTNMNYAFQDCTSLTTAPAIPTSVTDSIVGVFYGCTSLVTAPEIPLNLTSMQEMFRDCTSLVNAPFIPNNVESLYCTFEGCESLVDAPIIPDGVTNMNSAFHNCISLNSKPIIPNTVTSQSNCYQGVITNNWKGTQTQAESFLSTFYALEVNSELKVYNNDRTTYEYSYCNVGINSLSTFLSGLPELPITTPYRVYIRDLTTNAEYIKPALQENDTKYVDLSYTTIPNRTDCSYLFYYCETLVKSPVLPTDATDLNNTFYHCVNLTEAPTIPSGVTNLSSTFEECEKLTTPPIIPSGVTDMNSTFCDCTSLVTAPVIPNGVTTLEGTFWGCIRMTTPPSIPNSVRNMRKTFLGCAEISVAPIIPEGVENIQGCFSYLSEEYWCKKLTTVPYIPSTITNGRYAFERCNNLVKIEEFKIPLNTIKNNTNFGGMFTNCPNLRTIGYNCTAEDWHLFSLKIGQSDISGKIYSRDKTSKTIASTSITKSTIKLPVLTDELWFPDSNTSDQDVEDVINDVLTNKYGYYNGTTIDPSGNQFVMYAEDPNKVVSNLPTDMTHASGVLPVANGGTGQTTQLATNKAIIAELTEGTADVTDGTMFVSSNATDNGFAETNDSGPNRPYKRKFSAVWNYIKSKIQNAGSLIIGIASTVGTKLKLKGMTYGTNTYTDNNPKVVFENTDASQNISLTFTDYDAVQSPASLTLNGNQGGEYFIAPNVKATSSVYAGSVFSNSADNNSSWWTSKNPRGKFVGTNGGSTTGWSPLLAGKTYTGKYELGSLNKTIYFNYYKDGRTTNGIDKTIFDYTEDGTPNWNGNASTSSNLTNTGKQAIFDIVHPIGEIYVQYPGSKTPADLYNVSGVITSSWQEQSYSGAFFRASGGNAAAFITGTTYTQQAGQNGYHRHTISHTHALTGTQDGTAATASATSTVTTSDSLVYRRGDWSIGLGSATKIKTGGTISVSTTLSGNTSGASTGYSGYDGSSSVTENRPPNLTIRIWKRTA